jgi:hypothetical protein
MNTRRYVLFLIVTLLAFMIGVVSAFLFGSVKQIPRVPIKRCGYRSWAPPPPLPPSPPTSLSVPGTPLVIYPKYEDHVPPQKFVLIENPTPIRPSK